MSTPTISERIRSVAARLREFEEDFRRVEQERDQARIEADAFATYRAMTTGALGIDAASCALDVKEAIEALSAAGRTVVDATDEMRQEWDEIEAGLRDEIEELRLTLAAEQGKPEGAPSTDWKPQGSEMWLNARTGAAVTRGGWPLTEPGKSIWTLPDGTRGICPNARAAMIAADEKETTR